ncbi:MAG: hypothetical protein ACD_11C00145G0004 [uncultured bacterium]|nr:MAG: hypothetical protein ACD_11C00145G0004 [uncultured bacterium]HBR71627.1 hypothetical protein [Candidatus Moranbacteria bacterium]
MQYELFYLIGQNNEGNLEAIKKEVEKTLTDEGAEFLDPEVITKRKFSYEIKHQIKGAYIARRFEMPEKELSEKEIEEKKSSIEIATRKLNLNSNVLRFIIVKADELPELKQKEAIAEKKPQEFKKTRKPEAAPAKEEAKKEEDIDKKLEEILNI